MPPEQPSSSIAGRGLPPSSGDVYFSHADLFSFKCPIPINDPTPLLRQVDDHADAPPVKSYAAAVSSDLNFPSILKPSGPVLVSKSGSLSTVRINSEVYNKRLALCQYSLIARIILNKGDSPWTLVNLKHKLSSIWSLQSQWHLISLG